MLALHDMSVVLNQHCVLRNITATFSQGALVLLSGGNGVGKTTLLNAIAGLVSPLLGDVLLRGRVITGLPVYMRRRLGIAYVPQKALVFPGLTVKQHLEIAYAASRQDRHLSISAAEKLFVGTSVLSMLNRKCGNLSSGQKQLVSAAVALLHTPPILLMDEPFVALAPEIGDQLHRDVEQAVTMQGSLVIIAEHSQHSASLRPDRTMWLQRTEEGARLSERY